MGVPCTCCFPLAALTFFLCLSFLTFYCNILFVLIVLVLVFFGLIPFMTACASWTCVPVYFPSESLLPSREKTLGFLASGEEGFNLGPVMRLDRSELLCNKILLK